jgi:photosystem II stability/assembly factor-like uncharacterized protein
VQNGIYKTSDSGNSWSHIESTVLYENQRVISIHPTAPETIYAATAGGLFMSSNSGQDWIMLYPPYHETNEYRAFAIHPIHPNILFAGGVMDQWKSTDGGQSWYQLNIWPRVGIEDFVMDPLDPETMYLTSGSIPYGLGIWKSTDTGDSWFPIQNNIDSSYAFGSDLALDPVDSDILYFGLGDPDGVSGRLLWKSTDGGPVGLK